MAAEVVPPGDRSRLKTDTDFLLTRLQEFKARDKYGRGLITGATFSNVLDDFGLTYGQPEVAKILEYCVINGDGFVIYKDLIRKYSPGTPRAKQSETEKFLLKANDLAMKQEPHLQTHWTHAPALPELHDTVEMGEFLAHQTEEIRRLYSRWDRGMLTDQAFLRALSEDLKVPLTEEFRHALAVHGPARNLSFSKMLRALRIDNFLAKGTVPAVYADNPGRVFTTTGNNNASSSSMPPRNSGGLGEYRDDLEATGQTGRQPAISEVRRNPVTWDHAEPMPGGAAKAQHTPEALLRHAICLFCDGKIGSWVFRQKLKEIGVKVTMEVDRLIRQQEADNSAKVSDFLAVTQRQNQQLLLPTYTGTSAAAPSSGPSVPSGKNALPTPYATEFTTRGGGAPTATSSGGARAVDRAFLESGGADAVDADGEQTGVLSPGAAFRVAKTFVPDAIANRNAGDIIAWRGDQGMPVKLAAMGHQHERLADIITWHDDPGETPGDDAAVKPSKRRVNPFTTSGGHAAPFGTDADRGKTAEQCETLEYRPATGKIGLRG
ncbi:unnamed protein product [Amoebophrya sp. A120]|nr:unnamed protein product [Amoebophrya sp. A120]|eukprot:GSA120T00000753001.1